MYFSNCSKSDFRRGQQLGEGEIDLGGNVFNKGMFEICCRQPVANLTDQQPTIADLIPHLGVRLDVVGCWSARISTQHTRYQVPRFHRLCRGTSAALRSVHMLSLSTYRYVLFNWFYQLLWSIDFISWLESACTWCYNGPRPSGMRMGLGTVRY